MANSKTEIVYNGVLKYCRDEGYIKALKKSLVMTEGERFNQKKIDNFGLDVIDSVYCVYDKDRTKFFLDCINAKVKKGDVVVEAGAGTGILSIMSSVKGASIYSVELNKKISRLAEKIISLFLKKKLIKKDSIDLIEGNAITYNPPERADVIISENIYTGMFYEKQVQIMNHLSHFLKKGGVAIPSGLIMGVTLVNANLPEKTTRNELFNVVEYRKKLSVQDISESIVYENLDFTKKNKLGVDKKITFKVVRDGQINGILLWSKVLLPNKKIINRFDTAFLNSDILFPSAKIKNVKKGDTVKFHIKYKFGSKPKQAIFNIF